MHGRRRRTRALTLAFLLVVAISGCGGGDDDAGTSVVDPSSTTAGERADGSTDTTPDEVTPPGTDLDGVPTQPDPDTPSAPPTETIPGPAGDDVPAVGDVGTFGPWYLRADAASSILLEVRSQSGAEPAGATVERIRTMLEQLSGKAVSTVGGSVPGGPRQWTSADVRAEADRTGPPQRADAAVLTLLFLRGGLAGAEQTIGVAVRSDVAAIFSDRVDEGATPLAGTERIEAAVTTHEVGHLLGLVDLVLQTGRADPDHPGHSPNRDSVMYFAVESTLVGDLLAGGPPVDFDQADLADLRAIGGR